MLGNFSFKDYFKREAIGYAWDFLTNVLRIDQEKLWVTVYEKDPDAEQIWIEETSLNPKHLSRCGKEDNFWAMGDTGPCGPCSEIFYDRADTAEAKFTNSDSSERFVEIWNLVFMQYNRLPSGELIYLEKPSIDTGMGLERIATVMQNVSDNYQIDIFQKLIKEILRFSEIKTVNPSVKVIADHIRSSTFLIADGIEPSNEGRGYVLRRIIRRAIRHANKLKIESPFFFKLVDPLVAEMGEAYPRIRELKDHIESVLKKEEEQFSSTLKYGLKMLNEEMHKIKTDSTNKLSGQFVFILYDTYGFPMELTKDIAKEQGIGIDEEGYLSHMRKQKVKSRKSDKFTLDYTKFMSLGNEASRFEGYNVCSIKSKVLGVFDNKKVVVLDQTPFYAEAGGQTGDIGKIYSDDFSFSVLDVQKYGDLILHIGNIERGNIEEGVFATSEINKDNRKKTAANHTTAHLLQSALQKVLGSYVEQKGSFVSPEYLRFDFSSERPLTINQIEKIERIVNENIWEDIKVSIEQMSLDEAKAKGAMALFSEKYGKEVRVVKIGDVSIELCAGTHVVSTGEIGFFKILSHDAVASKVRRIEAVTRDVAFDHVKKLENELDLLASTLRTDVNHVIEKVRGQQLQIKVLEKEFNESQNRLLTYEKKRLVSRSVKVNGVNVISEIMEGFDIKILRNVVDQFRDAFDPLIIVLATIKNGKIHIVSGVSKSCVEQYQANKIMKYITGKIGGHGGGRPDIAQGGGTNTEELDEILQSVYGLKFMIK